MTNGLGQAEQLFQETLSPDTTITPEINSVPLEQANIYDFDFANNYIHNQEATVTTQQQGVPIVVGVDEPDRRLAVIQRALDFIVEICNNPELGGLWSVLLLQQKLSHVRDYLLSESQEIAIPGITAKDPAATTLLHEIDQRISDLSSKIDSVTRQHISNHDPMGFDLLNKIRHWFLLGGRSKTKDSGNTAAGSNENSNEESRKRIFPSFSSDATAQPLIKYRRVDNTFPKYMPNDVDDYSLMAEPNQRKEQDNNTNHNAYQQPQPLKRLSMFNAPQTRRVRNPNSIVTIDLSDTEDNLHNESNMYQAFVDRLGTSESILPPRTEPGHSTKPNFLYSDAVRYGTNGFVSDLNYPRPSSSLSSSEVRLNGHVNKLYDNVMILEEDRSEHTQYINLINNLTLHEQERPHTHLSGGTSRDSEKPPPPPPPLLQRINLNADDYLRGLIKNKSETYAPLNSDRTEYAKLLASKSEQSNESIRQKAPPELLHSIGNNTTTLTSTGASFKPMISTRAVDEQKATQVKPPVSRPLTKALQLRHSSSIYFADNYTDRFNEKCARIQVEANHAKKLAVLEAEQTTEQRRAYEQALRENLSKRRFISQTLFVVEELVSSEEKELDFISFTEDHLRRYNDLIRGPGQQVLVSKFSLNITRSDIHTLIGSCWLNDEIINFYMNLLTDRSQRKEGKLPSVYAMNTFFVPRLLQNGHSAVKRWTRKVDLFSKDIIPVPVHVGGVHWCMAIIHMKNKTIRYYDSMGKPNQLVLNALECYLREESLDKRKKPFDTSGFSIENVQNVPQQTNGSDCGVFSCMFAEYITRNKPLNFSQEHMDYFRKKMVLEICGGELWM